MKTKLAKTQKLVLFVAGALLILIGTLINSSPADFYAANSIDIGSNINLLNELKAPAGFLITAGLFIIGAIFVRRLADSAISLAALIYLSYATSRFASMVFDGVPTEGLVQAALLEAVVGAACLAVLLLRQVSAGKTA